MLNNKVALVTGAGSGIGEAVSLLFAKNGARVLLADVDLDGANRVLARIEKEGGTARVANCDVSQPRDVERAVADAVDTWGQLNVAVNNAGIGGEQHPLGEYSLESWDKVIAVNLSGVFYGLRYQIPAMLAAGGGAIVNMASILGTVGFASSGAYVAAKHGVLGLTQNAALEYAAQGIRVNSVGPGFIMTPLLENNLPPEQLVQIAGLHPMQRLGTSEEVAELVMWLVSEKASFVTGAYYTVDGGYLAQ